MSSSGGAGGTVTALGALPVAPRCRSIADGDRVGRSLLVLPSDAWSITGTYELFTSLGSLLLHRAALTAPSIAGVITVSQCSVFVYLLCTYAPR